MKWFIAPFLFLVSPVHAVGLAGGMKIGEVTADSALVWTRLTEREKQDPISGETMGAVPGMAGEVAMVFWEKESPDVKKEITWKKVSAEQDFTHQFELAGLAVDTAYELEITGRDAEGVETKVLSGGFQTAPAAGSDEAVSFLVSTCQAFRERDDEDRGHLIYRNMRAVPADFFVQTGDAVYHDRVPFSKDLAGARAKWALLYSMQNYREFHAVTPSYWLKDDHDLLKDDCWPGESYGDLTWEQGLQVWYEQLPMSPKPYRTFRWGKHVQVWFPEGREFRSANTDPDGPDKTILGEEQWAWLRKTMAESDATYRIFISATPVVGPDRKRKNDNHANQGFKHAGDKLRKFLAAQPGCFVICGDRHWQYHSTDPTTGLKEFGCGPASDEHAQGFRKSDQRPWQTYLRNKGGFLSVEVGAGEKPVAKIRHHNIAGEMVNEIEVSR